MARLAARVISSRRKNSRFNCVGARSAELVNNIRRYNTIRSGLARTRERKGERRDLFRKGEEVELKTTGEPSSRYFLQVRHVNCAELTLAFRHRFRREATDFPSSAPRMLDLVPLFLYTRVAKSQPAFFLRPFIFWTNLRTLEPRLSEQIGGSGSSDKCDQFR